MAWDPLSPTQGLAAWTEAIARRAVAPLAGFGDVGPSAGVGADVSKSAAAVARALLDAGPITRVVTHLLPQDDYQTKAAIEHGMRSIALYNPLSARVNINWGYGDAPPTADPQTTSQSELIIPGQSVATFPIPTEATSFRATVLYPGAVPADDANYAGAVYLTTDVLPVFVGPLA